MEILKVEAEEYASLLHKNEHVFNSVPFTELNKDKCAALHHLVFWEKKARLGIISGERDGMLLSPFSAPFGGFDANDMERIEYYESAASMLKAYAAGLDRTMRIVLPPSIYGSFVSKSFSALTRNGARIAYSDLNYAYELSRFDDYEEFLERSARKNFHQALQHDFHFEILDGSHPDDITRAYAVIRTNREAKGFPLRMSLDEVLRTAPVVKAEFFVLTYGNEDVAAAMVYPVREGIAQVVYWGDNPSFSDLKVMNFFTFKVFAYYYSRDFKYLDIGPSTEDGIPNYGLCSFKENLGCTVSLKHTLEL